AFLQELTPFIWRKYLDYAAIADVHAMKRQIHVHRGFSEIAVAGHNIKLGRGGIREIEFFVQTQQLIAGGRQPDLRSRQTLVSLERLAERGWIKPETRDDLDAAYRFLRWLEHRIQMVADEQTHQLPAQPEQLEIFARFCGYETTAIFEVEVRRRLEIVQRHYSALFEDLPQLSMASANLVFAGEDDDPETVTALSSMGFQRPSQVIGIVRAWHRGRYPAVASEKSRERLTEVQPLLIEALSDTVDPDAALIGFDRFLSKLPTGIALFALLKAQPEMMTLLATIAGSAPRLADILSRRRRVFDAVLDPRIIGAAPEPNEIATIVADELGGADSYEEVLDRARIIGGEQMFLVGARILSGVLSATRAGEIYALIAEELIRALHAAAEADFSIRHGTVQDGAMGVIAMGKLGGWEMTASSDLDLITVYDFDPDCKVSDGRSPLSVNEYYARLTQRLISALSAPTTQGLLYDVDLRLRPSGQKGPVATQLSGFIDYQTNQAWTWEHLALTRARVLSGPPELRRRIEGAIRSALMIPRDRAKIATDVRDMRARIEEEKGTDNIWDMKQVRGGLVDIEFACQFLQLVYAAEQPQILDQNTQQALKNLRDAGYLSAAATSVLLDTHSLIQDLGQVTRLCFEGPFDPHKAPDGLKQLLAIVGNEPTFSQLEARLRQALDDSAATFEDIMN
ncbi:MAG: bifunctional [glutamine synthetase] adenylyltransferase/[glutamine synthetase]-adenylyl-L-tyrosine phosphorylase, partial [Hyphomicrobiaceae bacterium]